jgi:alginate production protein
MKNNGGQGNRGLNRSFRTAPILLAWFIAYGAALSAGMPAGAVEGREDRKEDPPTDASLVRADIGRESLRGGEGEAVVSRNAGGATLGRPSSESKTIPAGVVQSAQGGGGAAQGLTKGEMAQFQWPPRPTQPAPQEQPAKKEPPGPQEQYAPSLGAPARPVTQFLKYQYSYGSESEILYRRNPDLNDQVKDNSLILVPQVNGLISYRPTRWLEATLEMIFDWEIAAQEEKKVVLPSGETQIAPDRGASFLVDQAFVTLKGPGVPIEFTVGRRNYEDERHWLYDTSMDIVRAQLKLGRFRAEGTFGREVWVDLDLFKKEVTDQINTAMLYLEYRGIEDTKLALYTISRDDRAHKEGHPIHIGGRILGTPSDNFNYWLEGAYLTGSDEVSRKISAGGLDFGATYQFRRLPFSPSLTLGYAFGSGDRNPNDNKNNEFRQTGLQSNERRFAGYSDFKYYGEGFDPELSNLQILTVGLGFRPTPNVSVDLVYHRYWLHKMADTVRNSALTAEINQDESQLTRDMGNGLDVVVGWRRLFGVRRLGYDLRVGWYFPGKAYRIQEGTPDDPTFRAANKSIGAIVKFWY